MNRPPGAEEAGAGCCPLELVPGHQSGQTKAAGASPAQVLGFCPAPSRGARHPLCHGAAATSQSWLSLPSWSRNQKGSEWEAPAHSVPTTPTVSGQSPTVSPWEGTVTLETSTQVLRENQTLVLPTGAMSFSTPPPRGPPSPPRPAPCLTPAPASFGCPFPPLPNPERPWAHGGSDLLWGPPLSYSFLA